MKKRKTKLLSFYCGTSKISNYNLYYLETATISLSALLLVKTRQMTCRRTQISFCSRSSRFAKKRNASKKQLIRPYKTRKEVVTTLQ